MRIGCVLIPVLLACGSAAPPPAATAPAATTTTTASVEKVDGAKAHELVASGAQLVDVRSADEYAQKHVDGAVNVPLESVASHDFGGKDKPLVLYCTAGHRSAQAADQLRAAGYTRVYLLGPMSAWDSK